MKTRKLTRVWGPSQRTIQFLAITYLTATQLLAGLTVRHFENVSGIAELKREVTQILSVEQSRGNSNEVVRPPSPSPN